MNQLQTCPDCGQLFCPYCGEHYPGNVGAAPQAQKQNLQVAQRKPALGPQWDTRTFPDSLFTYLDAYVSTLGPHAAGPNAGQKIRTRWASPTACVREYLSSHAASGWNANTVIPDGRIQMFWEWVGDQIGFLTWNSVVPGKNYSYIEGFFFGLVNSKVAKLAPGAKTKSDVQASLRTFLFGPVFAIGTCVPGLNPYAVPPSSAQWPAIPPSTNTAFWTCIAQKIGLPINVYEGSTNMQDTMAKLSVYEGASSMQNAMAGLQASQCTVPAVEAHPYARYQIQAGEFPAAVAKKFERYTSSGDGQSYGDWRSLMGANAGDPGGFSMMQDGSCLMNRWKAGELIKVPRAWITRVLPSAVKPYLRKADGTPYAQ